MCILFYGVKRVAFNYKYYFDFEVFFSFLYITIQGAPL